jgi:hypothetical protein
MGAPHCQILGGVRGIGGIPAVLPDVVGKELQQVWAANRRCDSHG